MRWRAAHARWPRSVGFKDLIVFDDPVGNRLEAFHGAELATEPFKPGRSISGFRTGPLGMGHAVLTTARLDEVMPFYTDILGFRLSDYILRPFKAYFFHLNPRHHSLAFVDTGKNGVHHLMVELCYLDDVGQAYDLALRDPERIGATFGRHANDEMTSFYSISPSKFMVEYGWGGRSIDPSTWTPQERTDGPSLWGHDRMWLSPEKREEARAMRIARRRSRRTRSAQCDGWQLSAGARRLPVVEREQSPRAKPDRRARSADALVQPVRSPPPRARAHLPEHSPLDVRHTPPPLVAGQPSLAARRAAAFGDHHVDRSVRRHRAGDLIVSIRRLTTRPPTMRTP